MVALISYLSPGSEAAILGSIGACYTAIDSVLKVEPKKDEAGQSPKYKKAFVNVRPPGHHCTNSEPMGFCWVNNVLIGCMYSYLTYDIDRICIVDIDLHHGNGSQEIVWRINEQVALQPESSGKRRLMISYSSLHDINSYPCEDGDPVRIKDASLNICVGNAINQFIQNLHLEDWVDEPDFFDRLYPKTWQAFEQHMSAFFRISNADPEHSLIFVSAGKLHSSMFFVVFFR
jgi:histone deacetylase HOS3